MKFIHKETGSVDDRDGWITSYSAEELEERGLTAEEAFDEDEGVTLFELDDTNERVIFDNGGGITVQLLGWAHYYNDERQAAEDVAIWLKTRDTSEWDGHEDSALSFDPSYEDKRNGGYRVWNIHQAPFNKEHDGEFPIDSWGNTAIFFSALEWECAE